VPSAPRSASSAARVVYVGIVASTLIICIGGLTLSLTLGTATSAAGLLDWLALGSGAVAFLTAFRQRSKLSRLGEGGSAAEWWSDNAGKVLLIWGLLELTAIAGAVVVFATGHLTAFAALAALSLAGLGTLSPGRLG
jgi:hypothetical protein